MIKWKKQQQKQQQPKSHSILVFYFFKSRRGTKQKFSLVGLFPCLLDTQDRERHSSTHARNNWINSHSLYTMILYVIRLLLLLLLVFSVSLSDSFLYTKFVFPLWIFLAVVGWLLPSIFHILPVFRHRKPIAVCARGGAMFLSLWLFLYECVPCHPPCSYVHIQ